MDEESTPAKVRLSAELGPATDILDSQHAMVVRWQEHTKLWLAKKTAGCFGGGPDMTWARRLSDDETQQMLENPWRVFERREPRA